MRFEGYADDEGHEAITDRQIRYMRDLAGQVMQRRGDLRSSDRVIREVTGTYHWSRLDRREASAAIEKIQALLEA